MADLGSIGLAGDIGGCLFDLDGVVTQTASVHAAAWKETFDAFLRERSRSDGVRFAPFDAHGDYDRYVDGKPREQGIRSFLASRAIVLPDGQLGEDPGAQTVRALGARKNELLQRRLREHGVTVYPGSVKYLHAVRSLGIPCAVVSSSTNCTLVLQAAGITSLFALEVDGVTSRRENLPGKPAPDTFLFAARSLGVSPKHCVVFEDAIAGVEAGRAGRFGQVVGVDRVGQAEALRAHGASIVVTDLAELLVSQ
ncbi:HAD family hydrolase [Lacisediminihabitans sp. FW035]